MSKRNLVLFIIILVILAVLVLIFLYFMKPKEERASDLGGINFLAEFAPFRKKTPTTPSPTPTLPTDYTETPLPTTEIEEIKLKRVSSMPIAGFAVFQKERLKEVPVVVPETMPLETETATTTGTDIKTESKPTTTSVGTPLIEFAPALRYVARSTGNIYQTFADKIDERKLSSTLVPTVSEAYFGKNADSVIMRYLKQDDRTIATFTGNIPKESLEEGPLVELVGTFLPDNISDLSVSGDGLKTFYLFSVGENTIGIASGILGDKKAQIFDSPFNEWLSSWINNDMITLTTKPSFNVPGYMYAINPAKKDFKKLIGNINGLTTLSSPNGKLVLWGDNNLSLGVYEIATGNSTTLGVRTLPEKCVWGKKSDVVYCSVPKFANLSTYPDSWYKGEISFSDEIWKIDLTDNTSSIISQLIVANRVEDIDGIKLAMDEEENYLFFVNKKDSYLWELFLK